jgi:glutathione-regulated potassium-efflux system ancillary protein KefG
LDPHRAVVAVTAGVPADYYTLEGQNGITLDDLLSNLGGATLRLCQFDIEPMVKVYGTEFAMSDEDRAMAAKQNAEQLSSYAA